jgi:hypothetical protein
LLQRKQKLKIELVEWRHLIRVGMLKRILRMEGWQTGSDRGREDSRGGKKAI